MAIFRITPIMGFVCLNALLRLASSYNGSSASGLLRFICIKKPGAARLSSDKYPLFRFRIGLTQYVDEGQDVRGSESPLLNSWGFASVFIRFLHKFYRKKMRLVFPLLFAGAINAHADAPLRVGVTQFTYPFVMQAGSHQFYGFDIAMMTYICATIHRDCQYHIMVFSDLIPAVANKEIDVAINSITITPSRAEIVNFSMPYLVSETRFLAQSDMRKSKFSIALLATLRIGGLKGTITNEELLSLGVTKPKITYFNLENDLVSALISDKIDVALVDEPTANYWVQHSAGQLVTFGKPIAYGFGLGVAVNQDDTALLKEINAAIIKYQSSKNFNIDYETYLEYD